VPSEDVIANLRVTGTAQFTQEMSQARGATQQAGQAATETGEEAQSSGAKWAKAAAGVAIAYKGYGALKGAVDTTQNLAKSTSAFARASGLSRKESQSWVVVAQQRGIETKQMQMGMATLGRNLGGVSGPTKASAAALGALGVEQSKLLKMPMQERMAAIADGFEKMADGPEKAALAQKLFGRAGQQLLPVLNEGAQGLNDNLNAANKLVPELGGTGTAALDLAKKQRETNMAMLGLKVSIASALLPVISQLASVLVPIIGFFAQLMNKFKPLTYLVLALGFALVGLLIFDKVAKMMKAAKAGVVAMKGAMVGLNAVMAANPILLVVLAVAALVIGLIIAYKKIGWFRDMVDAAFAAIKSVISAVINWIISNWKLLATILVAVMFGPIAGVIALFFLMRSQFMAVVNAIKGAFTSAVGAIVGVAKGMLSTLSGIARSILRAFTSAFGSLKSVFSSAVSAVISKAGEIVTWFKGLPGKIAGALSGLGSALGGAMASGVKAALNAAISVVNSFINATNSAIGGLNKVPGVNIGKIGTISALAQGTQNFAGGLAVVGERGPELVSLPQGSAVTPLSAPTPVAVPGAERPIVTQVFLERRMIAEAIGSFASELQAAR
jgi:hypothetical protein